MFIRKFSILVLSAAVLASAVSAQALTAIQKVEKEISVQNADGSTQTRLVSAEAVTPGEKIVYTVAFTNDSAEAATDIVLAMPCLLYTSPSPRDRTRSRMPSSA